MLRLRARCSSDRASVCRAKRLLVEISTTRDIFPEHPLHLVFLYDQSFQCVPTYRSYRRHRHKK